MSQSAYVVSEISCSHCYGPSVIAAIDEAGYDARVAA